MVEDGIATRAIGKNARGRSRRIGKGKRASSYSGTDGIAKKLKPSSKEEDDLPCDTNVLPGALKCFKDQRDGSKGIRSKITKHLHSKSLKISYKDYNLFYDKQISLHPNRKGLDDLTKSHLSNGLNWLWLMLTGSNLLFFGLGSKRNLVNSFVRGKLHGEDVLEIDGGVDSSFNNAKSNISGSCDRVIRALLNTICRTILKNEDLPSICLTLAGYTALVVDCLNVHYGRESVLLMSMPSGDGMKASQSSSIDKNADHGAAATYDSNVDLLQPSLTSFKSEGTSTSTRSQRVTTGEDQVNPKWGGRYAHALAKLIIVVHEIDGDALSSMETQRSLSVLAACESVTIISTMESLNTPLLWDSGQLRSFNWTYQHVPTYESHRIARNFPFFENTRSTTGDDESSALDHILRSVTNHHKELFEVMCQHLYDQQEPSSTVVPTQATDKSSAASLSGSANMLSLQAKQSLHAPYTANTANTATSFSAEKGITLEMLLRLCQAKMITNNMNDLRTILKEFIDYRIMSIVEQHHTNGQVVVYLQLSGDQIRKYAKVKT